MKYKLNNGLYIPIEEKKPVEPIYLTKFNCPHCNEFFDRDKQGGEEATIGNVSPGPHIPHMNCPKCKKCMGCKDDRE